jgi:hypothetical protein
LRGISIVGRKNKKNEGWKKNNLNFFLGGRKKYTLKKIGRAVACSVF